MAFYNSISDPSNFVASFSLNPRDDFCVFGRGYFKAAATIAEHLLAKPGFSDYEAYPVVFLYRHSLELYLKGILYKAALFCSFKDIAGKDSALCNRHELRPLSVGVKKVLTTLFPSDQAIRDFSQNLMSVASDLEEIDPNSFSYRYPIDTKGNASTKHHQLVNLKALHSTMNEMLGQLETIDFGIDMETNRAQEIYGILHETQALFAPAESS